MCIESVVPSSHLILCRPLLLRPPIPPSIRVFSNESVLCMRWPKYWSFSFNVSPSKEHSELISFRMDLLDLLAVQGTLKSLLQHHSSKASSLRCSAFFTVQLSRTWDEKASAGASDRPVLKGLMGNCLLSLPPGCLFSREGPLLSWDPPWPCCLFPPGSAPRGHSMPAR